MRSLCNDDTSGSLFLYFLIRYFVSGWYRYILLMRWNTYFFFFFDITREHNIKNMSTVWHLCYRYTYLFGIPQMQLGHAAVRVLLTVRQMDSGRHVQLQVRPDRVQPDLPVVFSGQTAIASHRQHLQQKNEVNFMSEKQICFDIIIYTYKRNKRTTIILYENIL